MFGTSRFNQKRFNVTATLNEILLEAVFSDALSAHFGVSVEYHVDSINFFDTLEQYSLGAAAIPEQWNLSEAVQMAAKSFLASPIEAFFSNGLNVSTRAEADYSFSTEMETMLESKANVEAHVWFAATLSDAAKLNSRLGANIGAAGIFSEMLAVQPNVDAAEEEIALIGVTIPPGSELRIDSENYTVTLDGQNILHLQSGDWIALDRSLYSISVDSGTGSALSGEIIFTVRYL